MLEFMARRRVWSNDVDLVAFVRNNHGTSVAKPLTLEQVGDMECITEPTATLTNHAAQSLMDELWRCGLRPTEGSGSAGSLAATERHLDDMRSIAKGLLRNTGVDI